MAANPPQDAVNGVHCGQVQGALRTMAAGEILHVFMLFQ